ncbi:MAG: hypothetical protein WDA18_05370 [Candidatus Ratteibacteria bacterium]|jgi:hypothetical protein
MKLKSIVFKELPVHDTCWSITTGVDGNIYLGICGELTGGLSVFIAKYDPERAKLDYLLEVGPALGLPSTSTRAPYCKIHYCMLPSRSGKLYCATHCSGPALNQPIWRPWHTWDDFDRMHPGFHIFSFDPASETIEDFGIMSPNEGSRAAAFAEKKGFIYGITWPRNHFYIYDINKRKYRDMGRIGDVNAQVVWIDGEENGYTVDDLGFIVKYDVEEDRLIHLDVEVPRSLESPSEGRSAYDVVLSPDGKSVYGVVWNMERVAFAERMFRYDFGDNRIVDLGPAHDEHKLDHAGGLVFGDDGYLYYAISKKDKNRRLFYRMYLFRMDINNLKKEEICAFDDGDWHSEYIAKATKDFFGNLYFADTNNRPGRVYVYTPEGSGKESKSGRQLKKWG